MEIGKIIKRCRLEKGLTQEELGNKFYVSRQLVSKWENNRSYPDLNQLIQLSDFFNLSLDELMRGDKKMIKKKDFQVTVGRIGKWFGLLFLGSLFVGILYYSFLTEKKDQLYKNVVNQKWQNEDFYYTQIEDSIQYIVFKNKTMKLWNFPTQLSVTANANYTMDNRALISGVSIQYVGNKKNFLVSWNERDLIGKQLVMDDTFEYKKELQPLENQTMSYEFEKILKKELDIERPYLKDFLEEVDRKFQEINH
ncbi:helix-turn-helix domain-containing protein [Enterococcus sp. LJL99]